MDIHNLLYNQDASGINPRAGSLLVADPMMEEIYFSRSAVLVLDESSDGGNLGITLNKGTNITLHDLIPDCQRGGEVPVFCGGPVDMERLFLLHSLGAVFPGASEVIPGVFVGGNVDDIISYLEDGGQIEGNLRFFLGYSGWTKGQLQAEIARHSWAVNNHPDGRKLLTGEGNEFWRREVMNLGDSYRSWLMVPPDPSYN